MCPGVLALADGGSRRRAGGVLCLLQGVPSHNMALYRRPRPLSGGGRLLAAMARKQPDQARAEHHQEALLPEENPRSVNLGEFWEVLGKFDRL